MHQTLARRLARAKMRRRAVTTATRVRDAVLDARARASGRTRAGTGRGENSWRAVASSSRASSSPPKRDGKAPEGGTDNPLSSVMFPWERAVLDSKRWTGEMKTWQKAYWAAFALGVAFVVGSRAKRYYDEGETNEERKRKMESDRRAVSAALEGRSFISADDGDEDEDPFEGLTPEEIEALVRKTAPSGDAYDGMSPEEIEAYEREYDERRRANSGSGNLTWKTTSAGRL